MIFKNNELVKLDEENTTDPLAKDILAKFEEIKKNYNFPLRFRTRFGIRKNPTGQREPAQSIRVMYEGDYTSSTGVRVKVRYSKGFPTKKGNNRIDYVDHGGEVVERYMVINESDMDKAWYMLYVCPIVKTGMIKLENKQKEAADQLAALSKMAVVNFFLTDESSPIYSDHDKIRTIALSFGVSKANDAKKYSIEEVKLALINILARGEASKDPVINIKNFKEAVNVGTLVQKRAAVQQAIDSGVLYFNNAKFYWALKIGGVEKKILDIDTSGYNMKEEHLVRYLMNNEDARALFDKAVGTEGSFVGKQAFTAEDIENMGIGELRSRCTEAGIPAIGLGRTMDVLRKDLKEHFGVV